MVRAVCWPFTKKISRKSGRYDYIPICWFIWHNGVVKQDMGNINEFSLVTSDPVAPVLVHSIEITACNIRPIGLEQDGNVI